MPDVSVATNNKAEPLCEEPTHIDTTSNTARTDIPNISFTSQEFFDRSNLDYAIAQPPSYTNNHEGQFEDQSNGNHIQNDLISLLTAGISCPPSNSACLNRVEDMEGDISDSPYYMSQRTSTTAILESALALIDSSDNWLQEPDYDSSMSILTQ